MTTSTIQGIAVDPTPPANGEGLIFNGTVYAPTPGGGGGGLDLLSSVRDNNYLSTNSMVAVNMLVTGVFASAGGDLLIQVDTNLSLAGGLTTETARLDLFVDAVQVGGKYIGSNGTLGSPLNWPVSITIIATGIAAGNHTVTVKWASGVGGNIGTAGGADSPNVLYVWEIL